MSGIRAAAANVTIVGRRPYSNNYVWMEGYELICQRRQAVISSFSRPAINDEVLAFDVAEVIQLVSEYFE
jgi:hypothetical protein